MGRTTLRMTTAKNLNMIVLESGQQFVLISLSVSASEIRFFTLEPKSAKNLRDLGLLRPSN